MAGRPRKYMTAKELEEAIDAYFATCIGETKMTVTGLAYNLGFESRQSIYDYRENGEFSYIVKRAVLFVESGYEQALHGNSVAGPIFALKNMGWKDKSEVDNNHAGNMGMVFNYVTQPGNEPLPDDND